MTPRRYAGFWYRLVAALIDGLLYTVLMGLTTMGLYGSDAEVLWEYVYREQPTNGLLDFAVSWLLPAVVIMLFWEYKLATPGKMAISARIVDADSGARPSPKQWIFRYLGYCASTLPLGFGFLWIAFDSRKQGWHDKLANTVVIFSGGGPQAGDDHALDPEGERPPGTMTHIA